MKYLLIMALLLAIILGLNFGICTYIHHSTQNLLDDVKQVRNALAAQDQSAAAAAISAMRTRWEHDEPFWEAFTDHQEVEEVDILINRLEGYVDEHTLEGMAKELQELEYMLRQMTEKHQFRLENIF